ncbi:MAG: 2OG-Fe(II) oxygenase [Pseudomonadota bacterium]
MSSIPSFRDPRWSEWAARARRNGSSGEDVFATMRRRGFGVGFAREAAFGKDAPDGANLTALDGSGRTQRYGALAATAITQADTAGLTRILTKKAQLYRWDGFLPEDTCADIIALSETSLARSTTVAESKIDPTRTSETSQVGTMDNDLVKQADAAISKALGVSLNFSEPIQAQKYSPGQEYKAHYDYFYPGSADYDSYGKDMGQRTWTFMIYLNEGCEGGGTRFRKLDKTFQPKTGRAIIWNNLTDTGDPNPFTLHQGMKVRAGVKYVITKWFRDKGDGDVFAV